MLDHEPSTWDSVALLCGNEPFRMRQNEITARVYAPVRVQSSLNWGKCVTPNLSLDWSPRSGLRACYTTRSLTGGSRNRQNADRLQRKGRTCRTCINKLPHELFACSRAGRGRRTFHLLLRRYTGNKTWRTFGETRVVSKVWKTNFHPLRCFSGP